MEFMEMDIGEMLAQRMRKKMADTEKSPLELPFAAQDLRDGLTALMTTHSFAEGDIVRQKAPCVSYTQHYSGEPAIVCEILNPPMVVDEGGCGSAYYQHRLTMIIGRRAPDGDLNLFHVDGRRYEPIPKDELALPGDPA